MFTCCSLDMCFGDYVGKLWHKGLKQVWIFLTQIEYQPFPQASTLQSRSPYSPCKWIWDTSGLILIGFKHFMGDQTSLLENFQSFPSFSWSLWRQRSVPCFCWSSWYSERALLKRVIQRTMEANVTFESCKALCLDGSFFTNSRTLCKPSKVENNVALA